MYSVTYIVYCVPGKLQSGVVFPRHAHLVPLAVLIGVAALGHGVSGEAVHGFLGTGDAILALLDEPLLADALPQQPLLVVGALAVDPQTVLVVHTAGQTWQQREYQTWPRAESRSYFLCGSNL